MKTNVRLFLLLWAVINTQEVLAQQITPDTANVEYANVSGISLKLDIYLPKNVAKPYPVIVWIHGGGWRQGSKENPTAASMVQQGYAVVSINYRLSQQAIFPAQIHDCKAAIRWIRANAARYDFDSEHIGAWGSSAGGHLAAMLGAAGDVDSLEGTVGGNLQFSSRVQAVCDWYGPSNFPTICDFPSSFDHCSPASPAVLLIGGAIKDNLAKAIAASPITYVSRDDPPFLIMHGTDDMIVPFHQSVELDSALRAAGVNVQFHPIANTGHGGGGFTADSTRRKVSEFFDRHLKTSTTPVNDQDENTIAYGFQLEQNYPNPFNPTTTIRFSIQKSEHITLKVFDVLGSEITTLVNGEMAAGEHSVVFDAKNLASGIYFYQLKTNLFTKVLKAELLK
ncbi:MAG: alpha/beta hydrolase fold domain-containing protein [Stygiobacter sp.]